MTAWLRRGAAAAALIGERSDLWPAGALAAMAYLGWLPLLLAVAPPRVPDLVDLGRRLITSGSYPANVVALAVALTAGFLLLCLIAALAEVALRRALRPARGDGPDPGRSTLTAMAVMLLACVPVLLAAAWLTVQAIGNAPAVYMAPGGEASVITRLAATVVPQIGAVGAAALIGQAAGGLVLRHALRAGDGRIGSAIRAAGRDMTRRPGAWFGVALAGWLKDALLLLAGWALLAALWAPIAERLGPGLLSSPQVLVLLVGFVAIWLLLLLAGGALHAWISAWWLLETEASEEAG